MKHLIYLSLLILASCEAQSQISESAIIGGPFENRSLFFEDMPELIHSADTSKAWKGAEEKLIITGKILKTDGKTPVPNTILYYYHTDENGLYSNGGRHGDIRGWVKSSEDGSYAIYTARPAAYPNGRAPAHIHPAILEPGIDYPYYIDEFVFDDDKNLTKEIRSSMPNRGGSGVLRLTKEDGVSWVEHNIILGLNIPHHPENREDETSSVAIGEDLISFTPIHVWGPDRGSKTCPICKYGHYMGLLYFVGEKTEKRELLAWAEYLEGQCLNAEGSRPTFLVVPEGRFSQRELEEVGALLNIKCMGLTIASEKDLAKNKLPSTGRNTMIFYKKSNVYDKYIDLKPTPENFKKVEAALK